jgi:hypothetical protein
MSISGTQSSYLKAESESVILTTYLYKCFEQYSGDRDTTYCQ